MSALGVASGCSSKGLGESSLYCVLVMQWESVVMWRHLANMTVSFSFISSLS
jgi:hypothetical protein